MEKLINKTILSGWCYNKILLLHLSKHRSSYLYKQFGKKRSNARNLVIIAPAIYQAKQKVLTQLVKIKLLSTARER